MPCSCGNALKSRTSNCSNTTFRKCSWKEYRYPCCVPAFSIQSRQRCSVVCPLGRSNSFYKRLCCSEMFRLFYERGDLPCTIEHVTKGQSLKWFVNDLETLNLDYYLPIFIDGLCETKYPYSFIALQGVSDLVERASRKISAETLSKLIIPLKRALYTNDPIVVRRILFILQKLARGNDGAIGIALVPYFNQLLPIINILKERSQEEFARNQRQCNIVDDYGSDDQNSLVRLIDETLLVLEQFGGQDAFINIKYSIPTYEQQVDIKQLSTAQTNTMVQPLLEL